MKSTAAAAVALLLLTAQVDALAIRPAAIRPGSVLARPSIPSPAITAARPCVVIDESELEQAVEEVAVEQPRPKPAVIDQGQIIRPTAIQGGGAQVLLPAGRPLKPSDLIRPVDKETVYDVGSLIRPSPINVGSLTRPTPVNVGSLIRPAPVDVGSLTRPAPVEEVPFGGHGSSISTKPSRPVVAFPWMKPAITGDQNTQQRPAVLPVRQEEDDQVQIVLLPSDRPLRPSDLIPGSQLEQKPAVRPIPINQQVGGNGPDQFLPIRPIRPVVVAEEEEQAEEPQYVLLPNDRPLRPSDLIPGLQQQEQEKPAVRPIPINQQVGGNGPDQFIPIRPRPVVVAEEKPAVRPIPINQQVGGNGPDQFLPIRPIRPVVVAEEEQADEPEYVLLPNDRPLRPSDLIPGFQQEEKPALRPIPINQQVGGNGPDQFIPIRPRPVVVAEEKPAVRPIPINQQVSGNGPDQFLPIRPIRPVVVAEEEQADEPEYVLLPNDRPLRPSDLIPGFQQQEEKPALRPIPINQQVGGNGPDQFIPIRPRPVVVAEEKPAVRPIPINQQVGGNGPDQFLPIRPIRPVVVAEEEQADEPEYVLLPNDRPLRPSDLIPGLQQQEQEKPAVRPIPINQQVGGNGPDQFLPIRPRPVVVQQEEEVEEQGQQIVLLPNDRPLRPSDLIPAEQLLPQEPRPIFIRPAPAGQQQQNNWSKYPEGYLPVRPLRPVNDIIF